MPKLVLETPSGAEDASNSNRIASVPRFVQAGTDYTVYSKAEKVSDDEFLLKHMTDESLDKIVTRDVDEDCESIEWEGLNPIASNIVSAMDF